MNFDKEEILLIQEVENSSKEYEDVKCSYMGYSRPNQGMDEKIRSAHTKMWDAKDRLKAYRERGVQ